MQAQNTMGLFFNIILYFLFDSLKNTARVELLEGFIDRIIQKYIFENFLIHMDLSNFDFFLQKGNNKEQL